MTKNQYCVIMAGGIGSRFWPISRNSHPKQFLDILGTNRTFLQETFERFAKIIPRENILIVTGTAYVDLVKEQLPDIKPEQILAEPMRRNTAPCIAYAAYKIFSQNPDASMVVAPSDHFISNEKDFLQVIQNSLNFAANNDALITIGITPTRPETNYGYIQVNKGEQQDLGKNQKVYSVKTFTEKPNVEMAKVFMNSGEFFWNSGIFIWNVKTICHELMLHLPDVAGLFERGLKLYNTPSEADFIAKTYAECRGISIDYGVMEKASNVYCFSANFGWSDLGTWISLYTHKNKDAKGNVVDTPASMLTDVSDSVVLTTNKGKLVVLRGLSDYLVVDTDDVLLICPKSEEVIKEIITDVPVKADKKYL